MVLLGRLINLWVILTILANPMRIMTERIGLPNIFVPLRELLLYLLVALSIPKSDLLRRPLVGYLLIMVAFFMAFYLGISGAEDRHFEGVFYLRIYIIPFLFCVSLCVWMNGAEKKDIVNFCRALLVLNALIVGAGIALHVAMGVQPSLVSVFFGPEKLSNSWYIAGGVLRMGLPFSAPNNLGTYIALSSLLIFPQFVCAHPVVPRHFLSALAIANLVALLLTFSRSSMITLLLGAVIFISMPGVLNRKTAFRLLLALVLGIVLLVIGVLIVDDINAGAVNKWLQMNTSFGDPSMQGHYGSVFDALNRIDEYFLYGFPRGTVGPKAEMFTDKFESVENSVLGILFDMGIPCAAVYFGLVFVALALGYFGRFQWPVLLAFLLNVQFLPYVFSPELVSYFFCVYIALGVLQLRGLLIMPEADAPNPNVLLKVRWR